jgi:magnesium chelatase subunit I
MSNVDYEKSLKSVPGLADLISQFHKDQDSSLKLFLMEFALHGLAEYSLISKHNLSSGLQFKDLLSSMFSLPTDEDDQLDDDEAFGSSKR